MNEWSGELIYEVEVSVVAHLCISAITCLSTTAAAAAVDALPGQLTNMVLVSHRSAG